MIIVNADDWGRSKEETDIPLAFYRQGQVTSVTAMVFMPDSERAAEIGRAEKIPTGLHLNFIEPFSGAGTGSTLIDRQRKIIAFLKRNRYNQVLYNPFLRQAFEYVFRAQLEEFQRLYRQAPTHFDGHKHMHVCANMLLSCPIPRGQKVRRSFSFEARDKGFVNRGYRSWVNRRLASRYTVTEYFFALSQQLSTERFSRVCRLAANATVELMTHPAIPAEQNFVAGGEFEQGLAGVSKGSYGEL
jgi:predicted glycoside hydrolase/deacetylase ChbG (UPF0249 family)